MESTWTLNPQSPPSIQGKHWSGVGNETILDIMHYFSTESTDCHTEYNHIKFFSGEEANRKICLKRLLTCDNEIIFEKEYSVLAK